MPTTVVIEQTCIGDQGSQLVHDILDQVDILASGLIRVIEDASTPRKLNKIQVTPEIVRYSCGFDPKGSILLSQREIIVDKYKIEMDICKEDFRESSIGSKFGKSSWNKNVPAELTDAIELACIAHAKASIENWVWNGKKGTGDQFDGYFELFKKDADVIKVTAIAGDIDETNVTAQFNAVKRKFTRFMRSERVIKAFFVSSDIVDAYETLLIGRGISNGRGGDANTELKYGKIRIVEMPVFPEKTIVAVLDKNLAFATGLMQDYNEFRITDGDNGTKPDGKVYFKMVFGAGVNYTSGKEIIWYGADAVEGSGDQGEGFAGRMMNAPVKTETKEESKSLTTDTNKSKPSVADRIKAIQETENLDDLIIYEGDSSPNVQKALEARRKELASLGSQGSDDEDLDDKIDQLTKEGE